MTTESDGLQQAMNDDTVIACVDLIDRAGASKFELGYAREGVPVEEAEWYAFASYQGTRIMVQDHRSPSGAALALAERLLAGAMCRCRKPVTLSDATPGCRWRLMGPRWKPGCKVKSVELVAARGDLAAMQAALRQPPTRRTRRRQAKKARK